MQNPSTTNLEYGHEDASYRAAGELTGITQLVNDFYDVMSTLPEAENILRMHPSDLSESRQKLIYFLSGWLGGPKLYAEHYGGINIPLAHQHLHIDSDERDAWLTCMQKAIDQQNYSTSFRAYLIKQLTIPAERIRVASQKHAAKSLPPCPN